MKEFEDDLNTAVFTTKHVIEEMKPITYVSHDDDDGAWQFFSNDGFENFEEIARVVSLQEILNLDNSIRDIADMPTGHHAIRNDRNDPWQIFLTED